MIPCTYCDGLLQLPFMHFCRVINIERRRSSGSTDANLDWAKSSMCTSAQRLSSWSLQSYGRGCRPPVGVPTDARNPLAEVKAMASVTYCHLMSQCKSQNCGGLHATIQNEPHHRSQSAYSCTAAAAQASQVSPPIGSFSFHTPSKPCEEHCPNNFQPHKSSSWINHNMNIYSMKAQ